MLGNNWCRCAFTILHFVVVADDDDDDVDHDHHDHDHVVLVTSISWSALRPQAIGCNYYRMLVYAQWDHSTKAAVIEIVHLSPKRSAYYSPCALWLCNHPRKHQSAFRMWIYLSGCMTESYWLGLVGIIANTHNYCVVKNDLLVELNRI